MKKTFVILVMLLAAFSLNAQEKKIDFSKGTVDICTSSKITISGYDGKEVVIKGTNPGNVFYLKNNNNVLVEGNALIGSSPDSVSYRYITGYAKNKEDKSKGLTPLGSSADEDSTPIDQKFDILLQGNSLLIKDKEYDSQGNVFFYANNTFEILVPNSVKLMVKDGKCGKSTGQSFLFSSDALKIADFEGDLQVSSQYKAIELTDVSGPALANTLGGDIKVVFNKKKPNALFSLISNDGDIDISMPDNAKISATITGQEVLSNLNFKILSENFVNNQKVIVAELNGGGKKFDVKTEYGTVYLRKN